MESITKCSLEEAIARVKAYMQPITETEAVSLLEAAGRVLAEAVSAPHDQPPFNRSPLDGYALRAADTAGASVKMPVVLNVTDEVTAGRVSRKTVAPGEAIRIMTGAPIPSGADCVLRQEDTDYGEKTVRIYSSLNAGDNYCIAGEDYHQGKRLLTAGTTLTSAEIGLLASLGRQSVLVYKMPVIHLMTTGDELVMPGQLLPPGKIYDSNLYSIGVRLKELGFIPVLHQNIMDDAKRVAEEIRKASETAQIVITTGGVSVGKKDIMHEVLKQLQAEKIFWKIDLKPGTPTLCGRYKDTLIIGLSGNPFGAIANMEVFVRPILAYMSGNPALMPARHRAVLMQSFKKYSETRRYVRAIYNEGKVFLPEDSHASGILSSMCGCNCLLEIPAGSGALEEGREVWVSML